MLGEDEEGGDGVVCARATKCGTSDLGPTNAWKDEKKPAPSTVASVSDECLQARAERPLGDLLQLLCGEMGEEDVCAVG